MAKHKTGIKDLRAYEGPNVIRPDYWPKPPSKVKDVAMKIGEIIARPGRALEAVDRLSLESVAEAWHPESGATTLQENLSRRQEIELRKASLWTVPVILTPSNREALLAQALQDPAMPEAWHKEGVKQLEEFESEVIHG